jgi:Spy/CpxP family protein refolding chaperone
MPSAGLGALTDMPGAADMPELSNEQLDRMDVLRQSHIREMLPLRTDVQIKEMELDALWRAEKLDGREIAAKVNELSALRGRLELARVNHLLAMYEVMTPEQRKNFRPGARRGQRRGMMRGMRQGGPGPMMGGGMGPCQGPGGGDCGSD